MRKDSYPLGYTMPVGLIFVPDEETGGRRGSGCLAATKRLGTQGIGMLTPEPVDRVRKLVKDELQRWTSFDRQARSRLIEA
jgi:acetylornithine deacetylase/succinyl-diaminopimelate desuccinylase-like protein